MADENSLTMEIGMGTPEFVQCGDEWLFRVPVLIDGKEVGEVFVTEDDLEC